MAWKKRMLEDAGFDFVAPRTAKVPTDVDYAHQLVAFYKQHGHYAPTQTVGGAGLTKWWTEFRQSKGARGLASGDSTSAREARKVLKKQIPGFSFDAPTKAEINRASGRSFNGFLPAQRTPPVDLMIHARMHETPRSLWNSYNSLTGQTGELGALRTLLRRADLFGQVLRVDVDCNDGVKQGWLTGLDVQMLDAMHAVTCMVSPRPQAIAAIPLTLTDCHRSELVYLASGSRCGALFTDTEGRQIVISYDAVLEGHRSHKQIEHASARLQVLRTALELMPDQQILPPRQGEPAAAQWQMALGEMVTLVEALEPICKKPRRTKRQPSAVELALAQRKAMDLVERYLAVLKNVTSVKDWASRGVLSLSPIRHYVNLTFGPSTVARHLAARWHVTPCAMHLSGSLYHISSTGPNARFAAASVSALDRMAQTGSFMPSWLTSSPTLYLPGAERLHTLMPPPRDSATPTAMRYWLENVGVAIALAAKDAAGGTLVLMTGYERLNLLAQVIRDLHPDLAGDRLVVQSPGTGVSSCADEFTRKSKEGLRPIWLATGGAWTGLDLTDADKPADKDLLLTDLVIPGTPFGLDQNTTQMDRLRRMGFVAEIMVAQRKLRQGLGRLIRREGVQNRRIWMLDARLLNPTTAHRFGDLRLVLQQYLKTERF